MHPSPLTFVENAFLPFFNQSGTSITDQQRAVLTALSEGKKRIAIRSGHGVGKSTLLSWIILWFLMYHRDARIPVTAGTARQLTDTLWPEIQKWISRMTPSYRKRFTWSATRVAFATAPDTCFAVARTSRKENPEALQGFHAENLCFIIDEASGVPDSIFEVAQGSLTAGNAYFIMTGNPTRITGFFYDAFHKHSDQWETFHFSSADSALVSSTYAEHMSSLYDPESDEYRVRVLGEFPSQEDMDLDGFVPLFARHAITYALSAEQRGDRYLGVDIASTGRDRTVFVVRDDISARIVATEDISTPASILAKTRTLMGEYDIPPERVCIDGFGEGINAAVALSAAGIPARIVETGKAPAQEHYENIRAEAAEAVLSFVKNGGVLIGTEADWKHLHSIRWRWNEHSKRQVMSKAQMRKKGMKSPDEFDALALTFCAHYPQPTDTTEEYDSRMQALARGTPQQLLV